MNIWPSLNLHKIELFLYRIEANTTNKIDKMKTGSEWLDVKNLSPSLAHSQPLSQSENKNVILKAFATATESERHRSFINKLLPHVLFL
mgnify:FL=1